jgi:hypothetical protein
LNDNTDIETVSLDFTDANIENVIDVSVDDPNSENVLLFAAEEQDITLNNSNENVVYGYSCESFVITDGKPITIVYPFTAAKASYTRYNVSNNYGTLCLPFTYESTDVIDYYTIGNFNTDMSDLDITDYAIVPAGTPSIFKKKDIYADVTEFSVEGISVDVVTEPVSFVNSDGIGLVGTFDNIMVGAKDGTGQATGCYYVKNNIFYRGKNYFYVNAYRAYVNAKNVNNAKVRNALGTSFGLNLNSDFANGVTSVGVDEACEIVGYYSVCGQQIESPMKGVNIVKFSNGKFGKIYVK